MKFATYTYDVFGKVSLTDGNGNPLTSSAIGNRFLFTGREWLKDIGLYDYRNRVYSQDLGRFLQTDPIRFDAGDVNFYRYWLSRDPIGERGGLNLYGYVSNNPVGLVDPFGLEPGFGSPGARDLTDEQKCELFGITPEELNKQRQDDRKMQDALSDAMKDVMVTPIPAPTWWQKALKAIVKAVWKKTDPGEKCPRPTPCPTK